MMYSMKNKQQSKILSNDKIMAYIDTPCVKMLTVFIQS